jgi:hypothetical protein
MLMPAFHRFPKEAAIIGRLLAGYGDIDFTFARCTARVYGDVENMLRAIFRNPTESGRLNVAEALARLSHGI